PDVDWNKGAAVEWLIERLHAGGTKPSAVYIGDDLTDEDAFRRLRAGGYGIIVGGDRPTFARYRLDDTGEVVELLGFLAGRGVNRR
ncbi:MAG: trehalose-phosphatase, partial [Acidobacteriota bacterium]